MDKESTARVSSQDSGCYPSQCLYFLILSTTNRDEMVANRRQKTARELKLIHLHLYTVAFRTIPCLVVDTWH